MKITDYDAFVRKTDQYATRSQDQRRAIALYGLVGEIGSLTSAVKKCLLGEGGEQDWGDWKRPNNEIIEELGDVIWYCVSLNQVENKDTATNILAHDIRQLKREISGEDPRGGDVRSALDPDKKDQFLAAAEHFPTTRNMTFDHYQKLAFLTARTEGRVLLEVCIAVLSQLGAELLRKTLPEVELRLNKTMPDRPVNDLLGEIAWHLGAIASLLELSLDAILERNVEKVGFRSQRGASTVLHDEGRVDAEQFPRRFDISIVSVGAEQARMYFQGRRLGDDLDDNSRRHDGYRYHDVLHLALIAHLGWSPVFRGFMRRKRKSDRELDRFEDGARAQLVEEVVVKAIHSEGVRLAGSDANAQLFPNRGQISFRFVKQLHGYVEGVEVEKNQHWEWEDAIFAGALAYHELRQNGQGTVSVDLIDRKLTFSQDVVVDLSGIAIGVGHGKTRRDGSSDRLLSQTELMACNGADAALRCAAAKSAILQSLGLDIQESYLDLDIKLFGDRVCVKAKGVVQAAMWERKVVAFKLEFDADPGGVECTAAALADPLDLGYRARLPN